MKEEKQLEDRASRKSHLAHKGSPNPEPIMAAQH